MADPRQLAQLHRVAQLRRDRGAAALASAGRVRAAEEAALARAEAAMQAALSSAEHAIRAFSDDPACAQAQLWRRVARERAQAAQSLTLEQSERHGRAVADQDLARAALLRAETRVDQAQTRVTTARLLLARQREERELEDPFSSGTPR